MDQNNAILDPLDCAIVYYIKQLSPSDAASSKQIKLPKTEARRFCGDLRHKQRSMVTVLDHQHVFWEFLCTCYGCQYALSRVAVFCNTYQLRAGQYLMFYSDTTRRLRIAVTSNVPPGILQQVSSSSSSHPNHSYSHKAAVHERRTGMAAAEAESSKSRVALVGSQMTGVEPIQQQLQQLQQRQEEEEPHHAAGRDAVNQGCRDQGRLHQGNMLLRPSQGSTDVLDMQAAVGQQQSSALCSWESRQHQQQPEHQMTGTDASHIAHTAATLAAVAAAGAFPVQEQGSQNSSDSSSSHQVLSVCPDAQLPGCGHLATRNNLTPTSTAVGSLTADPAWLQLTVQCEAALACSIAAAAEVDELPSAIVSLEGTVAAAAAETLCADVAEHSRGMGPPSGNASADAVTAAPSTAADSPGSWLVCHEQLLVSPPAASTQLLIKARAKQRDRRQAERLKLRWRAVNSAAAGSAAALDVPAHLNCRGKSSSTTRHNGPNPLLLPDTTAAAAAAAAAAARVRCTAVQAAQPEARLRQHTQDVACTQGSSTSATGRGLDNNINASSSRNGSKAVSSTHASTVQFTAAFLPEIHSKCQQQQQLEGCPAGGQQHLPKVPGSSGCAPVLPRESPGVPLGVPGWAPDSQRTRLHVLPNTLPSSADLLASQGLKTSAKDGSSVTAAAAAAAAAADNVIAAVQYANADLHLDSSCGGGLLRDVNCNWQRPLNRSSSAAAAAGTVHPSSKRFKASGVLSSQRATACLQPDMAAAAAEGSGIQAGRLACSHAVKSGANQMVCCNKGHQQQPATAANMPCQLDSHALSSSMLRIPHFFDSSSYIGSRTATKMRQTPHRTDDISHTRSDQLLPLFQACPRFAFAASRTADLHARQQAATGSSTRLAHTPVAASPPAPCLQQQEQQVLQNSASLMQQHSWSQQVLPLQQQELVFEHADEWSAVSGLLMLSHCSC